MPGVKEEKPVGIGCRVLPKHSFDHSSHHAEKWGGRDPILIASELHAAMAEVTSSGSLEVVLPDIVVINTGRYVGDSPGKDVTLDRVTRPRGGAGLRQKPSEYASVEITGHSPCI